ASLIFSIKSRTCWRPNTSPCRLMVTAVFSRAASDGSGSFDMASVGRLYPLLPPETLPPPPNDVLAMDDIMDAVAAAAVAANAAPTAGPPTLLPVLYA